ncbi:MAG TPA: alpha/beta fold hydrolase [Casimicrobiaceae bacterium]|nr:alpha/beta fold hydrolase [Casimicrobiaceae bacterium]
MPANGIFRGRSSALSGFADIDGCKIHYRLEGIEGAPVVMLCHGLLGSLGMWRPQVAALAARYRILRFDNRGHGASSATPPPYTVAQLAGDAVGLLDALGIASAHFVGCSLGGMIGQAMGANHPRRLRSLVLVGSRSIMPPASMWDERIRIARTDGLAPLVPTMLERWFTPAFRAAHPEAVQPIVEGILGTQVEGFVGACMAIRDMDHRRLLPLIAVPTLVTSARDDPGVPASDTYFIQASIPGAEMMLVEEARHLFTIERVSLFETMLLDWLAHH